MFFELLERRTAFVVYKMWSYEMISISKFTQIAETLLSVFLNMFKR